MKRDGESEKKVEGKRRKEKEREGKKRKRNKDERRGEIGLKKKRESARLTKTDGSKRRPH